MKNVYRCRICGAFTEDEYHCGKPTELFLDGSRRLALSKLLSYILRHDPKSIGLELDREGWARIEDIVVGIRTRWRNAHLYRWVRPEHIIAIAMLDPKGRFEVRNGMIRARYGHNASLGLELRYPLDTETRILYHGTQLSNLNSILRQGIKPMKRMYVHLTLSVEDACITAARHGPKPVVLEIDAQCVRDRGFEIYVAAPTIRLTKYVPTQCIVRWFACRDTQHK